MPKKTPVAKVLHFKGAFCDCGREFDGVRCEAEAKQHARETGHSPVLRYEYDLVPEGFGEKDQE